MSKTALLIDGQNFLGKLEDVFVQENRKIPDWSLYDYRGLLDSVLNGIKIDTYNVYFAKLYVHPSTIKKSNQLIEERRRLITCLQKQGIQYHKAGNVRPFMRKESFGRQVLSFREKGVDVRIAVDMVAGACDKTLKTIILASSDSDYQPAVKEVIKRNVKCIYLGFEAAPNKGLMYTTSRAILIRNSEVLKFAHYSA